MEKAMEIVHFGHEHPLILNETLKQVPYSCNACGLRVLSSPYYLCAIEEGCNFYLHPACAQLPDRLHHYFLGDGRYDHVAKHDSLALHSKPRDDGNRWCGDCGKLCKNFTYHCSECEFVLHPQCGTPLEIEITHISHPQHPMVASCKEAWLLCDVCGTEHGGYFFSCHQCNFWIHQDCALLPTFVKLDQHPHYLSLFYSGSALLNILTHPKCLICGETAFSRFGLYCCLLCTRIAHVDCTASQMKHSGVVLHLPAMLPDTSPSLIMRSGVKELAIQESDSKDMLKEYHTHSLILKNTTDGSSGQESICDACIKPISPPYYECSKSGCNFLLHKFCADLPRTIKHQYHKSWPGRLASTRWNGFFSLFWCHRCKKYNNGFGYARDLGVGFDLDCALAPAAITHDSHEQHPLMLTNFFNFGTQIICCAKSLEEIYVCSVCLLGIHIDCARLPKTVTHKFDEHPLALTFGSSSDHLCEFCEEDIDAKYWFYHCTPCDQSFHVKCIPSTGEYSGIKFGGAMEVACHSDHPMTLVRTMGVCSQMCGYCHETIAGFEDGTALHCAGCDFWVHLNCGYTSSRLTVPSRFHWLKPFPRS